MNRSAIKDLLYCQQSRSFLLLICIVFTEVMDLLMAYIWLAMTGAAVLYGAANGTLSAVSAAVTEGAGSAVTLCIGIAGAVCLWSAVMEAMKQSGMLRSLTALLRPLLRRIFPRSFADPECGDAIALNFTANFLGLGNAATPAGLRAAALMQRMSGKGTASDEMCRLIVMNTASVQLIPATVAAVRTSLGCASAFDILPCVWITSICSVTAGLLTAFALEHFTR